MRNPAFSAIQSESNGAANKEQERNREYEIKIQEQGSGWTDDHRNRFSLDAG
jgi:hypothetical protein